MCGDWRWCEMKMEPAAGSSQMWKEFGRLTGWEGDVKADCAQRLRDVLDRVKLETGCGDDTVSALLSLLGEDDAVFPTNMEAWPCIVGENLCVEKHGGHEDERAKQPGQTAPVGNRFLRPVTENDIHGMPVYGHPHERSCAEGG
ncbi:uncharacterized protein LOC122391149 [Amphibalanus amphitrite]|uniref:uncharacterized protein LOC122391149 n=1 Tax=Amphibalanus amphitrite TaxID=1232801 RepID=UPI001C8FFBB1|nr:uncharacterized protein LOC122391149 [Amphibalanus amphitrite]